MERRKKGRGTSDTFRGSFKQTVLAFWDVIGALLRRPAELRGRWSSVVSFGASSLGKLPMLSGERGILSGDLH